MTRHTDADDRRNRRETTERTMGGVSHTNPMTGESFGESQVFERGRVAVVDGGEAKAERDDEEEEAMGEIDHTPRENAPSAEGVYTRGEEPPEADSDAAAEEAAEERPEVDPDAAAEEDADEEPV